MTKQHYSPIPLLRQFSFLKTALVLLLFLSTLVAQAENPWVSRTSAGDNTWTSVTYGNGLFVAVDGVAFNNRAMTSSDGINWTLQTTAVYKSWQSVTYGNGLFVAVTYQEDFNQIMTSPDGIVWTARATAALNYWQSVTYGNGLFVAVAKTGTGNRVMTSPNGIDWTERSSALDNDWSCVTYGNGLFVAVASDGALNQKVMTSPNGINWTLRTSAANNAWRSVTYGNGLFVAVASNAVMTSPDGINWTSRTSAANNVWFSVTYGNGLFVAVSYNGTGNRVMTSPDGITWTTMSSAADNQWTSITYGNGMFVAVSQSGTGNRVMTWTPAPVAKAPTVTTQAVTTIAQTTATGNGNITALGSPNPTAYGVCWNTAGSPTTADSKTDKGAISATGAFTADITGLTAGTTYKVRAFATNSVNTVYGAEVTFTTLANTPASDWVIRTSAADNLWTSVTYGNGLFVAVSRTGTGNRVMTSSDGITWTARTSAADNSWSSVTFGNGLFVAVAYSGTGNRVMTSTDGITWIARTSAADNAWKGVTYGNGLFVAVNGKYVMTSIDGINWTAHTATIGDPYLASVTYGNGLFVAVSFSNFGDRVMTSTNGINWTSNFSENFIEFSSVTYGNGKFVAVASNNENGNQRIFTSPDGINWTYQTPPTGYSWSGVTYGNGLFVAVPTKGSGNRVVTSPDGITWTAMASAADNQWNSITYGNGMFVAVSGSGTGNRVMTWSPAPAATAPTVTTQAVTSIAQTTATGNGNITALGSANPTAYGVCWNTAGTPTTADSKTDKGAIAATGAFTADMTGLTAGTKYYVRAFATNSVNTVYGAEVSFTTSEVVTSAPTVTTQAVTAIAQTTATGNGNITSLGSTNPTAYGVCWNKAGSPTTADSKTDKGAISVNGAFTADITGLTAGTTYKVRAFATNSVNTVYGEEVTFKTLDAPEPVGTANIVKFNESDGIQPLENTKMLFIYFKIPSCSNYDLSELGVNIDQTSPAGKVKMAIYNGTTKALLYQTGEISVTGGVNEYVSTLIPAGTLSLPSGSYAVAIMGNPTSGSIKIKAASAFVNTGVATIESLGSHGKYIDIVYPNFLETLAQDIVWYRAISVVAKGINKSPVAPTVTTTAISAITKNSASSGGNATSDGGAAITDRGVCWNTTGSPTISNSKTTNGTGTGVFSSDISGLSASTKYYVRAYATNCIETVYGEEVSFTTTLPAPTALSYSPNPVIAIVNTTNVNSNPTVTGLVATYTISPALPTGVTINETTGVISGTPTVVAVLKEYTVTASNTAGNTTATFTLTVDPLPVLEISTGSTGLVIGSGPIVIDPALDITGVPRDKVYTQGSVYFTANYKSSEDKLNYPVVLNGVTGTYQAARGTTPQGVSAAYNAASGVLTLTGNATVALYEAIFRTIQYQNTNPLAAVSTREVTFQLGVAKGARTIQLTLSTPLATPAQAVCGSGTVADLQATAPAGSSVRWYAVSTGGTALASTTALVAGKYYAESWDGTTASATRSEITLSINVIPAKPNIAGQSTSNNTLKLCPNDNIVCSNFNSSLSYQWKFNGNDIPGETSNQYKVPVGGAGNYSLYVKNTVTGCENISEAITVQLHTVTIPVVFEKKKSEYISILVVDNTANLYTAYSWTYADGSALPAGIVTNRQFLVLPPLNMNANYMVNITDLNACTTNSASKSVVLKTIAAKAAPTLNNGNFMVNMTNAFEGKLTVRIYSQSGVLQRVFTFDAISSQFDYQVNAAGLFPGMYNVEIGLGDFKQIQKIVIK